MKIHKLPTFAACLEEGGTVKVFVVPTKTLKMPPNLLYPIMLEYGFSMPIAIHDLLWTEEGIYATLSFDRTPCETFVPWASVMGMGPKEGDFMVSWRTSDDEDQIAKGHGPKPPAPPAPRAALRLVKDIGGR